MRILEKRNWKWEIVVQSLRLYGTEITQSSENPLCWGWHSLISHLHHSFDKGRGTSRYSQGPRRTRGRWRRTGRGCPRWPSPPPPSPDLCICICVFVFFVFVYLYPRWPSITCTSFCLPMMSLPGLVTDWTVPCAPSTPSTPLHRAQENATTLIFVNSSLQMRNSLSIKCWGPPCKRNKLSFPPKKLPMLDQLVCISALWCAACRQNTRLGLSRNWRESTTGGETAHSWEELHTGLQQTTLSLFFRPFLFFFLFSFSSTSCWRFGFFQTECFSWELWIAPLKLGTTDQTGNCLTFND